MRTLPTPRHEVVELVGWTLRSPQCNDDDFAVCMALMTHYAITAEELNR
jgi:hypothetical protein